MRKYNLLALTDHAGHGEQNSLYPLVRSMAKHPEVGRVDVASRGLSLNTHFFNNNTSDEIFVTRVDDNFSFKEESIFIPENSMQVKTGEYDVVWLRMPPPISEEFLDFLPRQFPNVIIFNNPEGIRLTGSKEFLMNFQHLCPPMKICETLEDIVAFKNRFPIVLKPFRAYGGNGIVKIVGNDVFEGMEKIRFDDFCEKIKNTDFSYLGVKYLQNVNQGDKRIVVVNGEIMGASLRLPGEGSWLCNISKGGSSNYTEVDAVERDMIAEIDPVLKSNGIVMYGVDTLVGDDDNRVLSEINTTSIGGLPQIEQLIGMPLIDKATNSILTYLKDKIHDKFDVRYGSRDESN